MTKTGAIAFKSSRFSSVEKAMIRSGFWAAIASVSSDVNWTASAN